MDAGVKVLAEPASHLNELSGAIVAPWTVPTDQTITEGGRTHAVVRVREWENRHAAFFLDWQARCGLTGTSGGSLVLGTGPLRPATGMMRAMACRGCGDVPRGGRPVRKAGGPA